MSKIVDQMCSKCMWKQCEKGALIQAVCLSYKESQEDIKSLTAERDELKEKSCPEGSQIVSEVAISYLYENHPEAYKGFYERVCVTGKAQSKERVFVEHIKNHLKSMNVGADVVCKICGKTIDEIYEETIK